MAAASTMAVSTAVGGELSTATDSLKQRVRLISVAQLAKHNTESSLWVAYKTKVYDVTDFAPDHPGGDDLILRYAGKDMGDVMEDPVEHSHSDSAFELLEEHFIGRLAQTQEEEEACAAAEGHKGGNPAYILPGNEGVVIDADFQPENTDLKNDFKKYKFLDLNRPLIMQVWNAKFSKEFYLQQVHSPRHLKEPARLFGPWYLEMFTRTPWYIVPLIWLPVSFALFARSAYQFGQWGENMTGTMGGAPAAAAAAFVSMTNATKQTAGSDMLNLHNLQQAASASTTALTSIKMASLAFTIPCFLTGILVWTILEYVMHRFLFHVDDYLPDQPAFLTLHFLLHGIHHYIPMDRLRLVMPPILFFVLSYPFTQLAHALFPTAVANGIISGAFFMYVGYDCMHYGLHHTKLPEYVRLMKSHHMTHHFADPDKYFGVTSRIWDKVFGTL